ncbi:hypothetical protein P3T76_012285 [Phytophthora citrophthora]|uniref:RxLR effector protein n=1 Tax=Phytophthora citrophthora TaxID=4793 RepID=A0AAD9G5N2_9STRA|nr:hypothetical protein P3T76_012285 [Phytophthora citrophthora]
MRLLRAVLVITAALSCSNSALVAADSGQAQIAPIAPSQETNSSSSFLNGETEALSTPVPATVEERGVAIPSSIMKVLKNKKVPTPILKLLTGNKHEKSQLKLRALLLRSLPPEQASKLIFLKMPTKVPKPLPAKLPKGIKSYDFTIPGVSNAITRLKMEIWFYYRYPPSYAFKQLGLVGKGSGDILHKQENYKYFKSYFDAWYESQKHLIF